MSENRFNTPTQAYQAHEAATAEGRNVSAVIHNAYAHEGAYSFIELS